MLTVLFSIVLPVSQEDHSNADCFVFYCSPNVQEDHIYHLYLDSNAHGTIVMLIDDCFVFYCSPSIQGGS